MTSIRKAIETGKGTLLVSLPKDWTKANGIKKGTAISIEEVSPSKLIIKPISATEEQIESIIEYQHEEIEEVINDLTAKYLLGDDVVRIESKRVINRLDLDKIKSEARKLTGFEIVEENSKKIIFQFLLETKELTPEKLVKRMAVLTEGMLKDIIEGCKNGDVSIFQAIRGRDDELDRLYFLLVRTLRSASIKRDLLESYGMSVIDLLDYRVLASYLESVGDTLNKLAELLEKIHDRQFLVKLSDFIYILLQMHEKSIYLFLITKNKNYQREMYEEISRGSNELRQKLASLITKSEIQRELVEILGTISRLSDILVDIADLTVPSRQKLIS